ncbi:metallophosphoesterase [Methanocella sp. CWC-04]|uniref:Metallophosphoesterase n=2 Tax=Methanooceanicella nereidis TaxID=2052831 RepID=A0AAP2RCW1_9EURY|nr:metallophosphoesterase [Methanocella sp. CWC-04]
MGDLHFKDRSLKSFQSLLRMVNNDADVLVLCGDLTSHGLIEEAKILAEDIMNVEIPVVAVLGNHDHEADNNEEIMDILEEANVKMLERGSYVYPGGKYGFAGTKGFGGGFLNHRLAPFGEKVLKAFVEETYREANKVNKALKDMTAEFKVVVYHYAPIKDTCYGESLEVLPFLGSSILSDPPNSFKANLVLHGHAHNGVEKGRTVLGIPVRNVALPLHNKKYVVYDTTSF